MNYAIMLSGGVGTRMRNDGFPKQYMEVDGKPILLYALEPFVNCPDIHQIVIVAAPVWQDQIRQWLTLYGISKDIRFTDNGQSRQESLMNGLLACAQDRDPESSDKVLIHEAVRPLVTPQIIRDCLDALDTYDCCMPIVPIHDSTFLSYDHEIVTKPIDRDHLFCGQSPEAFRLKPYLQLNREATPEELTRLRASCELPLSKGYQVKLIPGDPCNFKLTRPGDIQLFRAHLLAKKQCDDGRL